MRTIITLTLILMLLTLIGCGNQDKAPEQSKETQAAVTVPKTDLFTALVVGDLEAIRQHIKAGSDINVLEPSRASTPLITAAAFGKTEAAIILINAGAALNYQNNDGSTALHTAAFFCREEIVKALLEKGADKTLRNKMGRTARETVEIPFEEIKPAYDAIGAGLKPAGVILDYDRIKAAKPKIAEMLK